VKRAPFLFAGLAVFCLGSVVGCGSHASGNKAGAVTAADLGLKEIPKMGQAAGSTPELEIMRIATPQEKTTYLKGLAKDSNFDPKAHATMLEELAKDPDADLAAAAKELLDKK
jgi:hypothetical protein